MAWEDFKLRLKLKGIHYCICACTHSIVQPAVQRYEVHIILWCERYVPIAHQNALFKPIEHIKYGVKILSAFCCTFWCFGVCTVCYVYAERTRNTQYIRIILIYKTIHILWYSGKYIVCSNVILVLSTCTYVYKSCKFLFAALYYYYIRVRISGTYTRVCYTSHELNFRCLIRNWVWWCVVVVIVFFLSAVAGCCFNCCCCCFFLFYSALIRWTGTSKITLNGNSVVCC